MAYLTLRRVRVVTWASTIHTDFPDLIYYAETVIHAVVWTVIRRLTLSRSF